MRIIALTGGIAMGKSAAARIFRLAHVPVFDADAVVHQLQACGGAAVEPIASMFPGTVRDGAVDRAALRRAVLIQPDRLRRLEGIIHPLVAAERRRFLARHRRAGRRLVVLDIPLLFESGVPRDVDCVAVVTAPAAVQMQRLRRRTSLTAEQVDAILARQMPDADKRRRADVLIRTGLSRHHGQRQIEALIARPGGAAPRLRRRP